MEEEYYLGIDVSKGYADFVILDSKKQEMDKSYQLDDTFEGHSRLYRYLERVLQGASGSWASRGRGEHRGIREQLVSFPLAVSIPF